MHPVVYKRYFAGGGLLLGNLGFVVGEFQVLATTVDIVLWSEEMFGDGGVFNMPTWPTFAPGGVSCPVVGIVLGFPEHEVAGMAFILLHFNTFCGLQVLDDLAGKFTVLTREILFIYFDALAFLVGFTSSFFIFFKNA